MRKQHWIEVGVGAFMLLGIVALIFLALRVSGLTVDRHEPSFTLTASFSNIGGLKPRSKVTLAGVVVGRVTNIQLDTQWYEAKVTMSLDQKLEGLLSTDTSASILTAGLLGENYIGLTVGAETDVLKDGDEIRDTQSALVLEDLINKFLINSTKD